MEQELLKNGIVRENLDTFLKQVDGIISGSFILSCLMNDTNYNDIDIFHKKDNRELGCNVVYLFESVVNFELGNVHKTPVCSDISQNDQNITYYRKTNLITCSVELIGVGESPAKFVLENTDLTCLKCYYDGEFHFMFDWFRFFITKRTNLLKVSSSYFEMIYDPWGDHINKDIDHHVGTIASAMELIDKISYLVKQTGYKHPYLKYFDLENWNHGEVDPSKFNILQLTYESNEYGYNGSWSQTDGLTARTANELTFEETQLVNLYHSLKKNYLGEDVSYYRIYKSLYRCLKYMSRGVIISNFHQFYRKL
jgi:hypothetical protein